MSSRVTAGPADVPTGAATAQQLAPEQGDGSEIYQMVLHDIITRSEFGARKYGHPLRTTADVDYLVNAYQELLDLLIYLRGEIHRRDTKKHPKLTLDFTDQPYEPPEVLKQPGFRTESGLAGS